MKKLYILVIVLAPLLGMAQPALEGGLFLGVSNYQGDLTLKKAPNFGESNFAAGLLARTYVDETTAIRANLLYGKLSGNDNNYADRIKRGFSFTTTLVELSVVGEWEPLGANRYKNYDKMINRFSPYLYGGLGMVFINPKPVFGNEGNEKVQQDLSSDYSKLQFSVPIGIGLKAYINKLWCVGLELGTRTTFTDYLDGISLSGEPGTKDWYLFGGAMVTYRIK